MNPKKTSSGIFILMFGYVKCVEPMPVILHNSLKYLICLNKYLRRIINKCHTAAVYKRHMCV